MTSEVTRHAAELEMQRQQERLAAENTPLMLELSRIHSTLERIASALERGLNAQARPPQEEDNP